MTLEEYLTTEVHKQRRGRFECSDQLALGNLIEKLEPIARRQKGRIEDDNEEAVVVFDFEYMFPVDFESWRGSYAELALTFSSREHSDYSLSAPTVSDFLDMCKKAVGSVHTGYKGGEYRMTINTPVWVANRGNSGNTALIDVVDDGYHVVLITGYREF